jgi:hypothetical protein
MRETKVRLKAHMAEGLDCSTTVLTRSHDLLLSTFRYTRRKYKASKQSEANISHRDSTHTAWDGH